jgi:hypothetical protein
MGNQKLKTNSRRKMETVLLIESMILVYEIEEGKGKAIPLQAWKGL